MSALAATAPGWSAWMSAISSGPRRKGRDAARCPSASSRPMPSRAAARTSPRACEAGPVMRAPVVATRRRPRVRARPARASASSGPSPALRCTSTTTASRPKRSTRESRTRLAPAVPWERRARRSGPRPDPVRTSQSRARPDKSSSRWLLSRRPGRDSAWSLIAETRAEYPRGEAASTGSRTPGSWAPGRSPQPRPPAPGSTGRSDEASMVSSEPWTMGRPASRAAMVVRTAECMPSTSSTARASRPRPWAARTISAGSHVPSRKVKALCACSSA